MAHAAGCFKRILQILEKWPVDKTKAGGRDYREFLEQYVNQAYKENKFESNAKYWDQQYLAIQKIVNNVNKNQYKRAYTSTSTGLTSEQCHIALSSEFLEELKQEEEPVYKKLFTSIFSKEKTK
ncbi:ubiquinol-cytochrome c reductase complex assembly factor 2 [Rhynchophorus ferrugineus]|uniref:Mitochondrial nucleoid factor 1 n=1 Tax=Rhynchophorus ferrugineus TaxID=354439 RepID=A0A834M6U5_RHYFE|nr:hypothetical protein GWI33_013223 [Rhynchophorus ferrugineus]